MYGHQKESDLACKHVGGGDTLNKTRAIMHEDPMRRRVAEVEKKPSGRRADHGREFTFVGSRDVEWLLKEGDIS